MDDNKNHPRHYLHALFAGLLLIALLIFSPGISILGWTNPNFFPPDTDSGTEEARGAFMADNFPYLGIGTSSPADRLTIADGNFYQGNEVGVLSPTINPRVVGGHTCTAGSQCEFPDQEITDIEVQGRYAYLTFHEPAGSALRIVDVSNPKSPKVVGGSGLINRMPSGASEYPKKIIVKGRYAYVIFNGTGASAFRIIDISNASVPYVVGGGNLTSNVGCFDGTKLPDDMPVDIAVQGNYAYIVFDADDTCALRVIDIGDPANPLVVGGREVAEGFSGDQTGNDNGAFPDVAIPTSIFAQNKYIYITFNDGFGSGVTNGFRVVDISSPTNPISIGGRELDSAHGMPQDFNAYRVAVSGRYAYVGFWAHGVFDPINNSDKEMFRIIDISNPLVPETAVMGGGVMSDPLFTLPDASFHATEIAVAGRYVYLAMDHHFNNETIPTDAELRRQFRVVDVLDPTNPQFVGGQDLVDNMPVSPLSYDDSDNDALAVFVAGRYAYVGFVHGDRGDGTSQYVFRIIDVTGTESSSLVAHSLEAGTLQVIGNAFIDTFLQVRGGLTVGGSTLFNSSTTITSLDIKYTFSKPAGSFLIDHPLYPKEMVLEHSFTESPDMKNLYDGIATLDKHGEAHAILPSYFEALNENFRYLLTPIGESAPNLYVKTKIKNNRFTIAGGNPYQKVSWQVTGIRKDPYAKTYPIVTEEKKETPHYLYPELYE